MKKLSSLLHRLATVLKLGFRTGELYRDALTEFKKGLNSSEASRLEDLVPTPRAVYNTPQAHEDLGTYLEGHIEKRKSRISQEEVELLKKFKEYVEQKINEARQFKEERKKETERVKEEKEKVTKREALQELFTAMQKNQKLRTALTEFYNESESRLKEIMQMENPLETLTKVAELSDELNGKLTGPIGNFFEQTRPILNRGRLSPDDLGEWLGELLNSNLKIRPNNSSEEQALKLYKKRHADAIRKVVKNKL